MIQNFLTRIFGSRNERLLKEYRRTVARINALESGLTSLTDEQLSARTRDDGSPLVPADLSADQKAQYIYLVHHEGAGGAACGGRCGLALVS